MIAHEFLSMAGGFCPRRLWWVSWLGGGFLLGYVQVLLHLPVFQKGGVILPEALLKIVPRCSWCGATDPKHEGGMEARNGNKIVGNFCKEPCYELWKTAHGILDPSGG